MHRCLSNAKFAPVVEAQIEIAGVGSLPLYGLDFVAAARSESANDDARALGDAVISKPLAVRLGSGRGQEFTALIGGRDRQLRVAGVAESPTEFVAVDIAEAQQVLGRFGQLDRIDVTVAPTEDFARAEAAIRAILPAGYFMQKPGARGEENQRMLRAFRWNLRVLSYISLVVGAFLIYNTISISVVRRRAEIGILRALGASRAHGLRCVPHRSAAASAWLAAPRAWRWGGCWRAQSSA